MGLKADLVSKHEGHLTLNSHGWKEGILSEECTGQSVTLASVFRLPYSVGMCSHCRGFLQNLAPICGLDLTWI